MSNEQAKSSTIAGVVVVVGTAALEPWRYSEGAVVEAARAALVQAASDVEDVAAEIEAAVVEDAAGAARVTETLTLAASTAKRVEEARLAMTGPLKSRAKAIEDAVRPLSRALEDLVLTGKRKLLAWQRAEAERVRKAREEAERRQAEESERLKREQIAAAVTGNMPPAPEPPPPPAIPEAPRGVRTDYGTASVRHVWDFEIVDAAKLPAMFLVPNEKAIRAAVNAGVRQIPGVRVFQRDDLAVRAR